MVSMVLFLGSFVVEVEPGSSRLAQKSNLNRSLLSHIHSIGQDVSSRKSRGRPWSSVALSCFATILQTKIWSVSSNVTVNDW